MSSHPPHHQARMVADARKTLFEDGDGLTAAEVAEISDSTRAPHPNKSKTERQIFALRHCAVVYFLAMPWFLRPTSPPMKVCTGAQNLPGSREMLGSTRSATRPHPLWRSNLRSGETCRSSQVYSTVMPRRDLLLADVSSPHQDRLACAISPAQITAALSSNDRMRPVNSDCGPSGPENHS